MFCTGGLPDGKQNLAPGSKETSVGHRPLRVESARGRVKVTGPAATRNFPMPSSFQKGPVLVGCVWGVVTGLTPFFQPIEPAARWALGLGLGLTYATIGVLVALLPLPRLGRSPPLAARRVHGLALQRAGRGVHDGSLPAARRRTPLLEGVRGGRRPGVLPDALLRRGGRADLWFGPPERERFRFRFVGRPLRLPEGRPARHQGRLPDFTFGRLGGPVQVDGALRRAMTRGTAADCLLRA